METNYDHHDSMIWPADTYDTIPDYDGIGPTPQIRFPLPSDWRSPFVGKSIPELVAFMRNVPKPPKPLNTRFCAIVRQADLDEGCIWICKSLEGEIRRHKHPSDDEESEVEDLASDHSEIEGSDSNLRFKTLRRIRAESNAEKRKLRAERAGRVLNKAKEKPKSSDEESQPEEDPETDNSEVEGPPHDLATIFANAEKARRKAEEGRYREERALDIGRVNRKRRKKPKHEDDYENIQLVPTSSNMVSMFLDGVEHERWDEYFCRWREDQCLIS